MFSSDIIRYFLTLFFIFSDTLLYSPSLPHLLQILERSNVLPQIYDILGFLNYLYFLYLVQ